jgi:transposase
VYQVHDWAKVRELVRQGVPRQRIAERLGCSRTTVYRLLSLETPPRYERTPAGSLLDPFKDAIVAMLADDATAPATVVREHLRRQGYGGGITILKDYLTEVCERRAKGRTVVGRNGQHWNPILAAGLTSFQGVAARSVSIA